MLLHQWLSYCAIMQPAYRPNSRVSDTSRQVKLNTIHSLVHSKLDSITHVATKVHVILRSFLALMRMCDTIELV